MLDCMVLSCCSFCCRLKAFVVVKKQLEMHNIASLRYDGRMTRMERVEYVLVTPFKFESFI